MLKDNFININANLASEVSFTKFVKDDKEIDVTNFTLVKNYGLTKEYIKCSRYQDKNKVAREFKKGDLVHVYGYFLEKKRDKDNKIFKNFIIKSYNKIEKNTRRNK